MWLCVGAKERKLLAKQPDTACFRRFAATPTETGDSRCRPDASNSSGVRPSKHGLGGVGCALAGPDRDAWEYRQHRSGEAGGFRRVFEACGWFYAAAGRWAANPRLSELYGGEMVLNNCIWCHTSPRSRVEPAASLQTKRRSHLLRQRANAEENERKDMGGG